MFKAMILMCSVISPNDCTEFTDNRGLHATQEQCKVRVDEMVSDIVPTLPPIPYHLFYKCEKEKSV